MTAGEEPSVLPKVKRGPPLYGHRGGGGRSTAGIGRYIAFAIRHPRRTFQQLLRRDFIELCKGDQIGGVGIAEAVLPRGNGLAADTQCFRRKLLRHLAADAVFLQRFAQGFGDRLLFLPHLLGINILLSAFTIRIWKHGKKEPMLAPRLGANIGSSFAGDWNQERRRKPSRYFYRMLQISPIQAVRQRFAHNLLHRKLHRDGRALVRAFFHPNGAAVEIGDLPHQRKPQSRAAVLPAA